MPKADKHVHEAVDKNQHAEMVAEFAKVANPVNRHLLAVSLRRSKSYAPTDLLHAMQTEATSDEFPERVMAQFKPETREALTISLSKKAAVDPTLDAPRARPARNAGAMRGVIKR